MLLIYGAYGYTGRLITELAASRGHSLILAGRDEAQVKALAADSGLPTRTFPLEDASRLPHRLEGVTVALNCAGPFARTAVPLARACIQSGAHYLDVTGEISVFEALAALDASASAGGVTLLPGVGFDVVPTDCLAAHLHRRLPDATELHLAFSALGTVSRGTALTTIEGMGQGGRVRRGGKILHVPTAHATLHADFGAGPEPAVSIPWGDVATAYHSTGIPDVTTYVALPPALITLLKLARSAEPLLRTGAVKHLLRALVHRRPPGPTAQQRAAGKSRVWGEARAPDGRCAAAYLHGPEAYTLTALTALAAAERTLAGEAPPGFQTPSRAFGPDFILQTPGTHRHDLT